MARPKPRRFRHGWPELFNIVPDGRGSETKKQPGRFPSDSELPPKTEPRPYDRAVNFCTLVLLTSKARSVPTWRTSGFSDSKRLFSRYFWRGSGGKCGTAAKFGRRCQFLTIPTRFSQKSDPATSSSRSGGVCLPPACVWWPAIDPLFGAGPWRLQRGVPVASGLAAFRRSRSTVSRRSAGSGIASGCRRPLRKSRWEGVGS